MFTCSSCVLSENKSYLYNIEVYIPRSEYEQAYDTHKIIKFIQIEFNFERNATELSMSSLYRALNIPVYFLHLYFDSCVTVTGMTVSHFVHCQTTIEY